MDKALKKHGCYESNRGRVVYLKENIELTNSRFFFAYCYRIRPSKIELINDPLCLNVVFLNLNLTKAPILVLSKSSTSNHEYFQ